MINVSNDYKQALTQPRTIDAKITYDSTTINIDNINSIKRSFNSTLFKTIAKQVIIDSNVSIDKDKTINPQFGLYLDNQFEYVSLGSYKTKNAPNLNKDTNSYEITAYDKIVESMVDYGLTESDITYPCTVRQLFVAIFTKLGWSTSGIPTTFVNSTSMIEEDVYSNVNMTYRDVLDELCTISCMFLIDVNGTPTLKQKTTTSETINEDFMSDTNVKIKNQVFFNSLVFSRASNSDNIYRKDDTSITNNGLHEFKVSDLQILSLNWRDNFIDAMWNYIKTFNYYAYEVNTTGITYLEPIDTFTLSTFGSTYSTILLNSDLTIANGVNEKIYANEPLESETEYKYADTTDKRINQTNLIVDKQNGRIDAVVSQVDEIEQELANPTSIKEGQYFDIEDALDEPLIDFSLYGETQQDSTTGKNLFNVTNKAQTTHQSGITYKVENNVFTLSGTNTSTSAYSLLSWSNDVVQTYLNSLFEKGETYTISSNNNLSGIYFQLNYFKDGASSQSALVTYNVSANKVSFTIPQDFNRMGNVFLGVYANATSINGSFSFQLEKGSYKTDFEPYTNGASPNPDYPQEIHNVSGDNEIKVCNKNLFDIGTTANDYESGGGSAVSFISISGNTASIVIQKQGGTVAYRKQHLRPNNTYNIRATSSMDYGRFYIKLRNLEDTGYLTSDDITISGWTYNSYYKGWFKVFRNTTDMNVSVEIPNCLYWRLGIGFDSANVGTTQTISNIQLEKGSTSSEYEAYQGNSQLISLGGKNKIPTQAVYWEQGGIDASTGTDTENTTRIRTRGYYQIKTNTDYYVSIQSASYCFLNIILYNSSKSYVGQYYYIDSNINGTRGLSINIPSSSYPNVAYMRVILRNSDNTSTITANEITTIKPQIELGTSATSFVEYNPIELNKIGTYQDYIYKDNDRWFLHKEIGEKVLNGSESWQEVSSVASGTKRFYFDTSGINNQSGINNTWFYSDKFKPLNWNGIYSSDTTTKNAICVYATQRINIRIDDTYASDVATFKTWLSTHNTNVYYVLANSTDTEITDTTLLEQLNRLMTLPLYKNMTHITLTPNDLQPTMKIEYFRDTSINNNFVRQPQLENYYTKSETTAQIQIGNASIQQSVSEIQTTLNSNGEAINTISNQVQNIQTSTSQQINIINEQLENGVEKVKTRTGFTFDDNGLSITKGEQFKNLNTDRNVQIISNGKEISFMGYDDNLKKTVARIDELESERATIGVHRTEVLIRNGQKRTAGFYIGGGN